MAFTGILTPNPLQFIRQYAAPMDVDLVFNTTADRIAYLTSVRRYPGIIVVDLQLNSKAFVLSADGTTWLPLAGVKTVTGLNVDNTDPSNPIIKISVDGTSITGTGLPGDPIKATQAAQVNSDWNATSGVTQILNRPTLATVATTGSYTDLINKPTIVAQSQSDWTQTGTSDPSFIKNRQQ